jgi:hypothetical protein
MRYVARMLMEAISVAPHAFHSAPQLLIEQAVEVSQIDCIS